MAYLDNKVEVDIKVRVLHKPYTDRMTVMNEQDYIVKEERTFNKLGIKEALLKLLELIN